MASRFWVGGGSSNTWAATANTNWSTTSGGANNASVPTTTDVAIFDSNSGTGNSVIGASIAIQGLDCTGGTGSYAGTITHNSGVTLTINTGAVNSLRFAAGMTYTAASSTSLITFTHTTGTATLTSAGQKLGGLTINGLGGTTTLADALQVNAVTNSTLTLTTGTLDAGTNTAAITACLVSGNNSNTRSLTLGGTVTVGGGVGNNSTVWDFNNVTGLTFTKNAANLVVLSPTTNINILKMNFGSLTYNNLTLNSSTTKTLLSVGTPGTFANIANTGWSLLLPGTLTITNPFTWTGTQTNPIALYSAASAAFTISVVSGSCSITWGYLNNCVGSGGATFTATNTLDGGYNTGWSISPPLDATVYPTNFAALGITAGGHISNVDTLTTYTGNTPQTGDCYARLGAPTGASVSADVSAVKTDTAGIKTKTDSLVIDGTGNVSITSNVKKNTAKNGFMFVMTDSTNHAPLAGATVTATRSIDGAAFAACTNAVSGVANGTYVINLSAADTNGDHIMYRFTATGADDLNIEIVTQP